MQNEPILGDIFRYSATGSSIKKPVFMRVCGHFEARRTIRHDPNDVAPKRMLSGSIARNGATILIEFFLKSFRILTAICIQYVTIDLCYHVCLRVA